MWRPAVLALGLVATTGLAATSGPAPATLLDDGVPPVDEWTCPTSHPIKAAFRPLTRQCVFHVPGGPHYRETRPDRCFATEEDARREDCWRADAVL